jgi:methionyl-tRNA synthetase
MAEKFYVTTPIYYVNARPHIGHAYTTIVADVLARRHRLLGEDVWFLTGTDEHGQKIERAAAVAGVAPQQYADQVSASFQSLWKRMGITNDQYIRTTDEPHKRGVQKLFSELYARGQIYLSSYTGQYSIGEEMFVEGPPGTIGPDGKPTETVTEENFFFRLSEYQLRLLDLIESDTLRISPEARKNEVLSFLRGNVSGAETTAKSAAGNEYVPGALKDLSVSRSSFTWGIPVPEPAASEAREKHVIYVWLDALANYITAVGYGDDSEEGKAKFARWWPADLHLVGKEIIRFHCVYWPAFLMAAGLEMPKAITAHGWLLFDDAKMSKSKGNIVRTETLLAAFGDLCPGAKDDQRGRDGFAADVLRYFLLREIPFGQDGSFSFDAMVTRYNADLANGYGNLVSRTLKMIQDYFEGEIPTDTSFAFDESAHEKVRLAQAGSAAQVVQHISKCIGIAGSPDLQFAFNVLLGELNFAIAITDKFISDNVPWKLAKLPDAGSRERLINVLAAAAESIRIITALLYPILPVAARSVWEQLGLGSIEQAAQRGDLADLQWGGLRPGTKLGELGPIFPRADKGLAQRMMDMEATNAAANVPEGANAAGDTTTDRASDFKVTSLASEIVQAPAEHHAPTDPAAGPRTASLPEENPGGLVGGSAAVMTERPETPSHAEAQASGIFASQPADASPQITIDDFAKVELRVARVLVCERIPKADKLLRLEVDLGYERRQILSGIAEWYTPEDLIGRRIVVITNLAPRKMRGLESHGMLLAGSAEGGKPALATFADTDELPLGARLK